VFVPQITVAGDLSLHLEPMTTTVATLQSPAALTSRLQLSLQQGEVQLPDLTVNQANLQLGAHLNEGHGTAKLVASLGKLHAAGQRLAGITVDLDASSPLGPWLGSPQPADPVQAKLALAIARGAGDPWEARGVAIQVDATTPPE